LKPLYSLGKSNAKEELGHLKLTSQFLDATGI
jgi:hypothetical protein